MPSIYPSHFSTHSLINFNSIFNMHQTELHIVLPMVGSIKRGRFRTGETGLLNIVLEQQEHWPLLSSHCRPDESRNCYNVAGSPQPPDHNHGRG